VTPGRNEGRETGRERCEKVGEERHREGSRDARVSYRGPPVFPVGANGKHCVLRFAAIVAAESNLPMTSESLTIPDRAHARSTRRPVLAFSVLDREPGALGRR